MNMTNANEFVITERRCEMCKTYCPCGDCEMVMDGKVIARFPLCLGCKKEMKETYKNVLNPVGQRKTKENTMAIELHHLNTHGMMEQACDVLDGVVRLKERIAELEKLNHDLCERVTENDEIRQHWEEITQTRAENERMKARIAELERMDTEHTVQIAKMNGYISHLEEERRWRKCSEELPQNGQDVWAYDSKSKSVLHLEYEKPPKFKCATCDNTMSEFSAFKFPICDDCLKALREIIKDRK